MLLSNKIKKYKQLLLHRYYFNSYTYFIIAFLLAVFYLCQHICLAPNAADGALILEYIRMVSEGKRTYWDFIDLYGPFNWYLPALFFKAFGNKVIGIRIWLVCLKLLSIGITYKIVKQSGSVFYALLAACVTMVLLGQPWQYLQTAYAFHTALPLTLLTFYVIVFEPFHKKILNLIFAGFLTSLIIWTKLNSGVFLFAGGLFYYFYWIPCVHQDKYVKNRWVKSYKAVLFFGLIFYGVIFYLYIARYFNKFYFWYLLFPLLLIIGWTLYNTFKKTYTKQDIKLKVISWLLYLVFTIFFIFIFYLCYFGWENGKLYWTEIIGILGNLNYMSPFRPLGIKGLYTGFNEYYWLQLPWFMTFLFCVWLSLQNYLNGKRIFRQQWMIIKSNITCLFSLVIFCSFVIYSRSDETHVFQAVLPSVPIIFFLLFYIESFIVYQKVQLKIFFRTTVFLFTCSMISTIYTIPSFQIFQIENNIWNNRTLSYLHLTTQKKYVYHPTDLLANRAAEYIDNITENYTEILVLSENQLLNYNSHTVPVGGRYQYLFYLLRSNLIDRKSFNLLIPETVFHELLHNPPKIITAIHEHSPLLKKIPEFSSLLKHKYKLIKRFGHIFIYERND